MQFDPAQLPAAQRQLYEAALSPASGRVFASIPASAILAADFNLKGGFLSKMLSPEILAAQFDSLGPSEDEIVTKLDELQKAAGVNLQADVLDLLSGDAGAAILARDQQKSDAVVLRADRVPCCSMRVTLAQLTSSSTRYSEPQRVEQQSDVAGKV
jgi:hypothetical protein